MFLKNSSNQKGSAPIPILIAILGVLLILLLSFFTTFKDKIFAPLYPKPLSKAVGDIAGATFSLSTAPLTVEEGVEVPVKILVRTDVHKANLFSAKINFDKDKLEVIRIDITDTFVTQWVERVFDNILGKVSVVGGVPKPGFSTEGSDTTMATVVFLAKSSGTTSLVFDGSSTIYRNSDNVNFLVGTTGITITIQPTATPTPTPSPTPEPSPTPTESPTPSPTPTPTPLACTMTQALWDTAQNPVDEGMLVNLSVTADGDCLDKQVSFEVREDDGLLGSDPVSNNPTNATFLGQTAQTSWIAEYQPDGLEGINDPPEYYFIATLLPDGQTISSQDPKLEVNKLPTTIFKKGDANRDGSVNLQDLSVLLSYWFDTQNFPDEIDINEDGLINTFDFSGMLVILGQEGIISGEP